MAWGKSFFLGLCLFCLLFSVQSSANPTKPQGPQTTQDAPPLTSPDEVETKRLTLEEMEAFLATTPQQSPFESSEGLFISPVLGNQCFFQSEQHQLGQSSQPNRRS